MVNISKTYILKKDNRTIYFDVRPDDNIVWIEEKGWPDSIDFTMEKARQEWQRYIDLGFEPVKTEVDNIVEQINKAYDDLKDGT